MEQEQIEALLEKDELTPDEARLVRANSAQFIEVLTQRVAAEDGIKDEDEGEDEEPENSAGDADDGEPDPVAAPGPVPDLPMPGSNVNFPYPSMQEGGEPGRIDLGGESTGDEDVGDEDVGIDEDVGAETDDEPAITRRGDLSYDTTQDLRRRQSESKPREKGTLYYPSMDGLEGEDA